jgi:hypothetical protein
VACNNGSRRTIVITLIGCSLGACASTQLNYNTLDLASTVDNLLTSQIVFNLGRFLVDPYANPAQVSIPSGSVTTTNQGSLTGVTPVNTAATATLQSATAAGAVLPAITSVVTNSVASATITPSVGNQASQNWTLMTDTDSDQERRLRALYRYATHATSEKDLCTEYPLIVTQCQQGMAGGHGGDTAACAPTQAAINGPVITGTALDSQFLREPGCVICSREANKSNPGAHSFYHQHPGPHTDYRSHPFPYCDFPDLKSAVQKSDLYINPRLTNTWLWADACGPDVPKDHCFYLGNYGDRALFTSDLEDYRQFVLFVQEATNQGSTQGQSGKSKSGAAFQGAASPTFFQVR